MPWHFYVFLFAYLMVNQRFAVNAWYKSTIQAIEFWAVALFNTVMVMYILGFK